MADDTCPVDGCTKARKARSSWCSMHAARQSRYGSPTGKPTPKTFAERVWAKVDTSGECWLWTGWRDEYGYGIVRDGRSPKKAHRVVWELAGRELTDGMVLDHTCYNPACVNPDHLREITHKQNIENFARPLRSSNTSGYRGVHLHKASNLWMARVTSDGKTVARYFKTKEEAGAAAHAMRLAAFTHNDMDRTA